MFAPAAQCGAVCLQRAGLMQKEASSPVHALCAEGAYNHYTLLVLLCCSPEGCPGPAQQVPCPPWCASPVLEQQHRLYSTILLPWLCDGALPQPVWRELGPGKETASGPEVCA